MSETTRQAIEWLVALRSGTLNDAQTHEFADWLSRDAANAQALAKAEDLLNDAALAWQSPRVVVPTRAEGSESISAAPQQMQLPISKKSSRALLSTWTALPLALAAGWLFAVGLILPEQSDWLGDLLSDYHTGTGEMREVALSDGSHVLLNTQSAISIHYSGQLRKIILRHGQARFSVAKDSARPFEVDAGHYTTRALGTVFEVYHPGADEVSVTVLEHAVASRQLDASGEPTSIQVNTGQRLHVDAQSPEPVVEGVDLDQASAWSDRKWFMADRPLSELIEQLNRYRNGRIIISDVTLKNQRITGAFSLSHPDETLTKVCDVLGLKQTRVSDWWAVLHR